MSDDEESSFSIISDDEDLPQTIQKRIISDSEEEEDQMDFAYLDNDQPKKLVKGKKKKGKLVPYEPVFIPPGDKTSIEKLLTWRNTNDDIEILVKYKNMSYHHVEWLPRVQIEESKMGKTRVKKFLEKPLFEIQWSEDEPFNPSYLKVDRIIDEGELEDDVYFLVKWASQTYDQSTWETQEFIHQLDADKIQEFHRRKILSNEKEESYLEPHRPSSSEWRQLKESPLYKNDNELRAYQLEGLNWLLYCWYNRQNSILADEMGLGKTIQSTAFMNEIYLHNNVKGPFLIITPLSTLGNWEREVKAWTEMNIVVYHGKDSSRNLLVETEFYYKDSHGDIIPEIYKFDVLLTTYEMAIAGLSQLKPIDWKCVVLDEAHRLKNKSSKISEILKLYHMEHKVLLTGTPLQNSLEELFSLLRFLEPEKFEDEESFQREYGNLNSAADVEKLQNLLKPLMLRRLKEDVEKTIPVKEETIVEVELTTIQKKWYRSILERNFSWLKQGTKRNNMPNLINTMIELRKCCIHPFLLKGAEEAIYEEYKAGTPEQHFQVMIQASGKMVLIDKLLRKLHAGGHKVLLFSQMTKCLDIIQDYLKGRGYGYERIDGSIRGDLRQAAIDRFCDKNSESFIFLLCTRAGGVGINLTVADTVIIFDSDWNPQNDLQAQARCHRIGQTKAVQIYRLVTRNTYERDMLDRASMKLGLDKAILQRMDAQNSIASYDMPSDMGTAPSSLSKQEVEELLKKGAYGAFMDDEASKDFCEEDIDQILERRTQTIRHDNTAEKGSIFSKATFSTSRDDDVDINDPDFWDKVAKKAHFEIIEEIDENAHLIVNEPRLRKQVQRFGSKDMLSDLESEDEDAMPDDERKKAKSSDDPKPWTITEKTRFERCLMLFGFSSWDKMVSSFPRRTVADLQAVARCIVRFSIKTGTLTEPEMLADINVILGMTDAGLPKGEEEDIPYPGANLKQITEYRSFLIDAAPDYREHMEKKAKNLLTRIQMLFVIREKIKPTKETEVPAIPGNAPASWWGVEEDRDLLLGVVKHGYAQYDKIRDDPELCFYPRFYSEDGIPLKLEDGAPMDLVPPPAEVVPLETSSLEAPPLEAPPSDIAPMDMTEEDSKTAESTEQIPEVDESSLVRSTWPGPADLGVRLRKIIAAFQRQLNSAARETAKKQQALERQRLKQEREHEKLRAKEKELNRKDKQEYIKVLLAFGVETDLEVPGLMLWNRFRELSSLRKSDAVLEDYYHKIISMCHEVVKKGDAMLHEHKTHKADEEETKSNGLNTKEGTPNPEGHDMEEDASEVKETHGKEKFNPSAIKVEKDGDTITYERGRKLLKRLELFKMLRTKALPHPHLEERVNNLKKQIKSGMPVWWLPKYDKFFLHAVARWGLGRHDLICEDSSLPFHKLYQEHLKARGGEEGKGEDRFWMKEHIAQRRVEILIEAILSPSSGHTPSHERKSTRLMGRNKSFNDDTDSEPEHKKIRTTASSRDSSPFQPIRKDEGLLASIEDEQVPLSRTERRKRKQALAPQKMSEELLMDPNVTLEDMLMSNKTLSSLYFHEYQLYKRRFNDRHLMVAQYKPVFSMNSEGNGPIEYSEDEDGGLQISSKAMLPSIGSFGGFLPE